MNTTLLFAVFSAFAIHAMADSPKPGGRAMANPGFDQSDLYFEHAIREASQQLVPRLNAAESIIIYSLSPERLEDAPEGRTDRHHFHGYPILGSRTLWRNADLASWRKELMEGLGQGNSVLCFEPRHAIRVHTRRTTTDMVLCFECGQMIVYGLRAGLHAPPYFFDREVRDALNQFLDAKGIPRDTPHARLLR